jgi:hypothetical protein
MDREYSFNDAHTSNMRKKISDIPFGNFNFHLVCLTVLLMGSVSSCKKWDDDKLEADVRVKQSVWEQVQKEEQLSTFVGLAKGIGLDSILSGSRTVTLFAPTNDVFSGISSSFLANPDSVRYLLYNHVAFQSYMIPAGVPIRRIQMMNGKYQMLSFSSFDAAPLIDRNKYASNGVYHTVRGVSRALPNCWEFIEQSTQVPTLHSNFLKSLYVNVFDSANAVQIGIDPVTGRPIYQPGSDSMRVNLFLRNVYDVSQESQEYTVFMLADPTWSAELARFSPYYVTGSVDSTRRLAGYSIAQDFAIPGSFTANALPDTVVSKFGVKVPISKSAIVRSIKTSNGFIHILNASTVQFRDKFRSIRIEGELFTSTSADRRSSTFFRDRFNPTTGLDFKDVMFYNHGVALFNVRYVLREVPSTRYRVFWVAVNDFQTAAFSQRLAVGSLLNPTFPSVVVNPNVFTEVLLGEVTLTSHQNTLELFLQAANSTAATVNPLVCDYIRLEPLF